MRIPTQDNEKENIPCKAAVHWLETNNNPNCKNFFGPRPQTLPPSRSSDDPPRSILKRSSLSKMSTPIQAPQPLQTPSVDSNNTTARLIWSPIETLVESLKDAPNDVSLHDICEAYDTLSSRIRFNIPALQTSEQGMRLSRSLRLHASQVVDCLERDVSRAWQARVSEEITEDTAVLIRQEIETGNIKTVIDSSTVCHSALKFLSDSFTIPTFHSIFALSDLGKIVDILFDIACAMDFAVLNGRKIRSMALWVLHNQRLPASILSPRAERFVAILRPAVETGNVEDIERTCVVYGMKAISQLLQNHPNVFWPTFSSLLPHILSHLTSSFPVLRHEAATTLGRYSVALLDFPSDLPSSPKSFSGASQHISDIVSQYMAVQWRSYSRFKKQKEKPAAQITSTSIAAIGPLPHLLISSLLMSDSQPVENPQWAASVLASLTVLSDYHLFCQPCSLKMILVCIAQVLTSKPHAARALHPLVWKCVIWAFTRIGIEGSGGASREDDMEDVRERAFCVVKQELGRGIGLALVASLRMSVLETHLDLAGNTPADSGNTNDLTNILVIVRELIDNVAYSVSREGLALLSRLVGAIGSSMSVLAHHSRQAWTPQKLLERALLDGTILNTDLAKLDKILDSLDRMSVDDVRPLSEEEIVKCWDTLLELWVAGVRRYLRETATNDANDLQHIWQSLLLVQAQLTQGHCHLTTPPDFPHRIAVVLVSFLPSASFQPPEQVQFFRRLKLVHQLWIVLSNVFAPSWLSMTAKPVLDKILRIGHAVGDSQAISAWSKLCLVLVLAGSPTRLEAIDGAENCLAGSDERRRSWTTLAQMWERFEAAWKDTVYMVVIPLRHWDMSPIEFELCNCLLQSAISRAKSESVKPVGVIQQILERLGHDGCRRLIAAPRKLCILLSHADLTDAVEIPNDLFTLVDRLLCNFYPPPSNDMSLQDLFYLLRKAITSAPASLVPSLLTIMNDGLCLWIQDEKDLVLEQEYNSVIMSLYCEALLILEKLPPTLPMLHTLERFLASAFCRMLPPALGPIALKNFWEATYGKEEELRKHCPEMLKLCLGALFDAYGGEHPFGLPSPSSQSESSVSSMLPDFPQQDELQAYPFFTDGDTGRHSREGHIEGLDKAVVWPIPSSKTPKLSGPHPVLSSLIHSDLQSDFLKSRVATRLRAPSPELPDRLTAQDNTAFSDSESLSLGATVQLPEDGGLTTALDPLLASIPSASPTIERRVYAAGRMQLKRRRSSKDKGPSASALNHLATRLPGSSLAHTAKGNNLRDSSSLEYLSSAHDLFVQRNNLDFASIRHGEYQENASLAQGVTHLSSPFLERPHKKVKETPLPSSSDGHTVRWDTLTGRRPGTSDTVQIPSECTEVPPTRIPDASGDPLCAQCSSTNPEDMGDSSSLSLGVENTGRRPARTESAPADAVSVSSKDSSTAIPIPHKESLRRTRSALAASQDQTHFPNLATLHEAHVDLRQNMSYMDTQDLSEAKKLLSELVCVLNEQMATRLAVDEGNSSQAG